MGDDSARGYADDNPAYWKEYSNLQRAKHDLIRHYLAGWFPKLGSWARRVLYVDTHAGKGKYQGGEIGSPLVALKTLLQHPHRDRLLNTSEFVFWFIEGDRKNLSSLRDEIAVLGKLPKRIRVEPQDGNCFEALQSVLTSLREQRSQMAPAFIFLDPYGFKLPGSLLRDLMNAGRVELLVTFMWRWVDMAIAQERGNGPDESQLAATLDAVFDTKDWRSRINSDSQDDRAQQAVDLLAERIRARWSTYIRMLGDNNATRYLLLHFTNHDDGRDLMKDCVWKICPDGGFYVRKGDNPKQEFLIKPTPDLRPLSSWAYGLISERFRRWGELDDLLRATIWREPHLRQVLKKLLGEGRISCSGKFTRKADPIFRVPQSN